MYSSCREEIKKIVQMHRWLGDDDGDRERVKNGKLV